MDYRVLVTGGLGYIGSHTTVELANAGFIPVIVDNLSNSRIDVLECISKIIGFKPCLHVVDLCDSSAVRLLAEKEPNIKGIIHFAAFKAVGESVEEPLLYYRNNLISLLNVLEAYKSQSLDFIFSSSCTVYGQPDKLPVNEATPLKPAQSPYGRTKQISERILEDLTHSNQNLRIVSLRYFNPVGAHESGLIGELPLGKPLNLVPVITQSVSKKKSTLTIFGTDYNTKDGTNVRDYVHVVDIAKAHVIALKKCSHVGQLPSYAVFNLGTGRGYSVLQLVETFENVCRVKIDYTMGPRRPGDVDEIWADVSKAEKELEWKAELNLDTMLLSAWNWEKNQRESIL